MTNSALRELISTTCKETLNEMFGFSNSDQLDDAKLAVGSRVLKELFDSDEVQSQLDMIVFGEKFQWKLEDVIAKAFDNALANGRLSSVLAEAINQAIARQLK